MGAAPGARQAAPARRPARLRPARAGGGGGAPAGGAGGDLRRLHRRRADPADGGALAGEAPGSPGSAPPWRRRSRRRWASPRCCCTSRRGARRGATRRARYVPLSAQDPARWDARAAGARRRRCCARAARLGRPGRYQWEAAVASAHAARRVTGETRLGGDPAALRRAGGGDRIAGGGGEPRRRGGRGARGRRRAWRRCARPAADARLADYQPCWAALAALAERAGEAATAGGRRASARRGLATDPAVRAFLLRQASGGPGRLVIGLTRGYLALQHSAGLGLVHGRPRARRHRPMPEIPVAELVAAVRALSAPPCWWSATPCSTATSTARSSASAPRRRCPCWRWSARSRCPAARATWCAT